MGAFSPLSFSPLSFSEDATPSPSPEAESPTAEIAIDHTALVLSRLPSQYRRRCDGDGETNTQKVLRILASPYQELEAAALAVLTQCNIDTAVGVQLDVIGRRVGRPRNGVTDDEIYRRFCRAQIAANKSDGLINDILAVARLVVADPAATFELRNEGAAAYTLSVGGVALDTSVAEVLVEMVIRATSAGVRPIVEYSTKAPDTVLRWGTQGVWGTGVWARATDKEI